MRSAFLFVLSCLVSTSLPAADNGARLRAAVRANDVARVIAQLGVQEKGGVDAKNKYGQTALHIAASRGHKEIAEVLLAEGATARIQDEDGCTPLDFAERKGHRQIASLLSEAELCEAAAEGDMQRVNALLAAGTNVNSKGLILGYTALHMAAWNGREAVVKLLIGKGADIDARGFSGPTPLYEAAMHDHKNLVELLIGKGADVNARNERQVTPLHMAALNGKRDLAKLLIRRGADVSAKCKGGDTALDYARDLRQHAVAAFLASMSSRKPAPKPGASRAGNSRK